MSGGKFTDYADYLKLDSVLNAQQPLSDHPDELHFIIIHQIHELWFRLAIYHLERVRAAMQTDQLIEAVRLLAQVSAIFDNIRLTTEHLHTLPPVAFHHFRQRLAPGSGMQSYQWREIEFLCGEHDPKRVEWVRRQLAKEEHWQRVLKRVGEPSLVVVFDDLLARYGINNVATIYAHPGQYPDLYALCEALSVFEQRVVGWRFSHIQLVERTIGAGAVGTGGTTHDYLQDMLQTRFFPKLWEARNMLTEQVNEGVVDTGIQKTG